MKEVKPLFKYIGGKTWLKNHLRQELVHVLESTKIKKYVEPFAGGLGAFLSIYDLLLSHNIIDVTLNDINARLINLYRDVKNSPIELLDLYMVLEQGFAKTVPQAFFKLDAKKDKEEIKKILAKADEYYKKIRNDFNSSPISLETSAKLLFLQKHCFNGIYRENSSGQYNTPFNWDGKSFSRESVETKINDIKFVLDQFNITFSNESFADLSYQNEVAYYLDPPYINDDLIENKYNKDLFGFTQQKELIEKISTVSFIYSNHFNEKLMDEFNKYSLDLFVRKIERKNIIAASTNSRKNPKTEILITNIIDVFN